MVSSLSAFLGEIGRHQLLTPEQELMLGRKVQAMVGITDRCQLAGGAGPGLGLAQRDPVAVDLHRPGKLAMLSRLALSVSLTQKRFAISAHLQQLV